MTRNKVLADVVDDALCILYIVRPQMAVARYINELRRFVRRSLAAKSGVSLGPEVWPSVTDHVQLCPSPNSWRCVETGLVWDVIT